MKQVHIYIGIAFALLMGCTGKPVTVNKEGFQVSGHIRNHTGDVLMLEEITPNGLVFVDSATVDASGAFAFAGNNVEKTFYSVRVNDYVIPIILDTASVVSLEIDGKNPGAYEVSGPEDNKTMRSMIQLNDYFVEVGNQLADRYRGKYDDAHPMPDSVQKQVSAEYQQIVNGRKEALIRFIDSLPGNSLVTYYVLNFLLSERDPDAYFRLLDRVDKKSFAVIPESKYVQAIHTRVEGMRKTAIGNVAPDIVMNDPSGVPVALSSLRGKYVLVDFWASWCGPCREENPLNVRLYNKYKKDGFEIYGVSLDESRDNWLKAIADDNLSWIHVSDLLKWNSAAIPKYNFESIPFNVLLDPEGKIIAKNLHGNDLEAKLASLFN